MQRKLATWAFLILGVILSASLASAQEARGAITGRVLDSQGALVPGARVAVTNAATNETRRGETNATGYYEFNYLEPSSYNVTVEMEGFKKIVRGNVTVNVGSRLELDFTVEVGQIAETVQVTSEIPLLETTTASGGRVLDQKNLVNLPFSDLNPFALTALAPGMQWTGQPEYRRPFDNGGTSAFNTMGGVGQNEYTIDGMTVTGTNRRVGFVPPADSITEFKLETSNFDASQGFTSGAAINVVSRSGSNKLSGSLFNQHWQQRWNATGHFARENWNQAVAAGRISPDTQKQATGRSNNYGVTASGPLWIPKVFNGKDKVFWTFNWNGIRQSKAETTAGDLNRTMPTLQMREGDFSQLLNAPDGARRFTIYDPRSARRDGNNVVRTPFPGNRGIPVLNPMYSFYLKLFPTPNNVPGLVTPEQTLNYLAFAMPKDEKFNSVVTRFDFVASDRHRLNVRYQWNDRLADEYDWTYETARGLHSNGLTRINKGGNVGWLWTLSSSDILDFNFGLSRFEEGSRNQSRIGFGPKDVGLPDYLEARAGANRVLPLVDFDTISDVSGGYPVVGAIGTTGELRLQLTNVRGNHSFKYGWQERRHFWTGQGPGTSSGAFTFRNQWTRSSNVDNFAANHAHDWAAFMLGVPNSISIDTNDSTFYRTPRRSFYFQDDWRVSRRLRLSLGLRYEREGGISERFNRAIGGFFLPDLKLPFTDAVKAAYAANPVSQLPAAQFNPVGGTTYLGQNGFNTATKGTHILLPKIGVVVNLNNKTVLRSGWGMYMDTLNSNNTRPDTFGYNQSTSTPISNDAGLTFCCNIGAAGSLAANRTALHDPFPVRANGTRFDEPLQNQLGAIPRVGRGFTGLPYDFRPPLQHRWRIGIQRELISQTLLDVSYNGAYTDVPVNQRIDFLPQQYWSTGNVRVQANDNLLNGNVTNPYNINNLQALHTSDPVIYNYLAGQGFFTRTVMPLNQLLRQFGHMSNVTGIRPGLNWRDFQGYNKYHDMQVLIERRYAKGLTSSFMYTWASSYVADFYLQEFDERPSERINNNVMPHRFAWTTVWETPFGKGRSMLRSGFLGHLVGNWNLSWIYQRQTGPATDWGNRFFYGDLNQLESLAKSSEMRASNIRQWFDGSIAYRGAGAIPDGFVGFEGRAANQPGSYHMRVFPQRLNSIRADGIRNWDLKIERLFPISLERGVQARFSVDLLNATNHTNFSAPVTDPSSGNFGRVTGQRGLPRVIQFNLRLEF
ncbi:MAG: carboxypeptidase regulatory-like domain-containing protein [Acidimicrobiia bacterium]|nr:carboxypeptidase regulatory-like domain-containing protein [Acidimicrobiia bacterium]